MRLLLVEDDQVMRTTLERALTRRGMQVSAVGDGIEALSAWTSRPPHVMVLDLSLPGMDGLQVLKEGRQRGLQTPVLLLTARGTVGDRIVGLNSGADDYLPKPFDPRELLVRIKVVLRRAQSFPERARVDEAPFVRFDQWRLDTRARQVLSAEGLVISLGNSDYRVLRLLLQHPNRPLSRDFLLNHVFDKDSTPFDRSIDVCVSRLRQQLAPGLIKTVRNEGYMLTSACVTSES